MVKDIRPDGLGSWPGGFTPVGGALFLTADDGIHGRELWSSDRTEAGTTLEDINPGPTSSEPSWLTAVGEALFFTADDGSGKGHQLWVVRPGK